MRQVQRSATADIHSGCGRVSTARNSMRPRQPLSHSMFQNLSKLISLRWVLPERSMCRWRNVSLIMYRWSCPCSRDSRCR